MVVCLSEAQVIQTSTTYGCIWHLAWASLQFTAGDLADSTTAEIITDGLYCSSFISKSSNWQSKASTEAKA